MGNMTIRLFNLKDDPLELKKIVMEFPDLTTQIANIMKVAHQTAVIEKFKMETLESD